MLLEELISSLQLGPVDWHLAADKAGEGLMVALNKIKPAESAEIERLPLIKLIDDWLKRFVGHNHRQVAWSDEFAVS
ncbi:hypothetical protein D3C71_1096800 [compost metagenome]